MSQKILIIGPSWVGDMVMAQTLFKVLQAQDPYSKIDVLAPTWTFSVLERMQEVNESIEMPITHGEFKFWERASIAKALSRSKYDHAIILPNSFKSALIPWLARIPKRTGWLGEYRYGLLNDIRKLNKRRYPLMIERMMALGMPEKSALIRPYPKPSLKVTAASIEQTLAQLKLSAPQTDVLALSPGAAFGTSKRWPPSYYAEVANKKLADGWQVWLFGANSDRKITQEIMRLTKQGCVDVAGLTSLAGTIDLLSLVTGLVTNDSGLMHIAAALAKPIVALYGSSSPVFTPPLAEDAHILKLSLPCQPCFKRDCPLQHHQCMRDLMPAPVIAIVDSWGN